MQIYPLHSLYRFRIFRRFRYGRGFGVHSPLAYALIFSLLRPFGKYYAYARFGKLTDIDSLWFRMLARLYPKRIEIETSFSSEQESLQLQQIASCFSLSKEQGAPVVCVTDDYEKGLRLLLESKELCYVLYLKVREDKSRYEQYRSLLAKYDRGVVLDFYDGALFCNNNNERYYYRTTL